MKEQTELKIAFVPWRFYLLSGLIILSVVGLIVRMVDLAVINRQFLQTQGDARALRTVTGPAVRGMITDRNGYPLAISIQVYSVWINPQEFSFDAKSLRQLSTILAMKPEGIRRIKNLDRQFVYLKRGVSSELASQIKSLRIRGIYLQQDYKRFYPEGETAAHVVGFTNIDNRGQEGLELAYNQWLGGTPGKKRVIKDRSGRTVSELQTISQEKPGNDLVLSINRRIQYLAWRELAAGVQKNNAVSGSVIVLDAKTGEVLAMVNQPSFNPNKINSKEKDNFRNRAVTDTFEPGSTIKAFSMASALESGRYRPESVIDTYPGWLRVEHHTVHDEHMNGSMNLSQILQLSSNVGITKIILSLPPQQLSNLLSRVGFGEITGIGFPGEQSGKLLKRKTWRPFALATLSFGYGISITALQLAAAYEVIANNGMKIPLSLLRLDKPPLGTRVMSTKVAHQMMQLLEAVLAKGGTGAPAKVAGYHVAGKTGTAWLVGKNGYEKHRYTSSFVGIAPVAAPRLVIAVVLHDPRGKEYYGGNVSGPVFQKIMEGSLRILNVPPDDPESLQTTN